ncbi:MAG: hypothetical protein GF384_06990 [Elusimicrobia bacterium]|nr:hypothetical protein [Elusimicrobiota bacterium]
MIIVCFGHEWSSWVRRANIILMGLCKKRVADKVIFFERPLTARNIYEYITGRANYTVKERCTKLFKKGLWRQETDEITVVTPIIPAVFFRLRFVQHINEKIRTLQHVFILNIILKRFKTANTRLLLWFQRIEFNSVYIRYIPRYWKIVYDCTEDYIELLKNEHPLLLEKYRKDDAVITEKADIITTVSREYAGIKATTNRNTQWISNGVDYNRFCNGGAIHDGTMQRKHGPLLAFIGIVNKRHDIDVVLKLAQTYPYCSIELVGSVDSAIESMIKEKQIPNIRILPGLSLDEIPAYLQGVNVCLSFYKCDYLNSSGGSIKIYQYLASGKPIVAYPVADAEYFSDVIYLAQNRTAFIEMAGIALNESPKDARILKRKQYAQQNDWSYKIEKFSRILIAELKNEMER